jgi:hypothetical protein
MTLFNDIALEIIETYSGWPDAFHIAGVRADAP